MMSAIRLAAVGRGKGFGDADDIAAVLHYRVARATARPAGSGRTRKPPRLIAGLLPQAHGVTDAEMRAALDERQALIEARADAVLDTALTESAPDDGTGSAACRPTTNGNLAQARTRDRRLPRPLPDHRRRTPRSPPESAAQKIDAARAGAAAARAQTLVSEGTGVVQAGRPTAASPTPRS